MVGAHVFAYEILKRRRKETHTHTAHHTHACVIWSIFVRAEWEKSKIANSCGFCYYLWNSIARQRGRDANGKCHTPKNSYDEESERVKGGRSGKRAAQSRRNRHRFFVAREIDTIFIFVCLFSFLCLPNKNCYRRWLLGNWNAWKKGEHRALVRVLNFICTFKKFSIIRGDTKKGKQMQERREDGRQHIVCL